MCALKGRPIDGGITSENDRRPFGPSARITFTPSIRWTSWTAKVVFRHGFTLYYRLVIHHEDPL